MILLQQSTWVTNPEKITVASENPLATPSGYNSVFPEKVMMDLSNGITSEVLMGYGWNLVVRTHMGFWTQIWKFDPVWLLDNLNLTFMRLDTKIA